MTEHMRTVRRKASRNDVAVSLALIAALALLNYLLAG